MNCCTRRALAALIFCAAQASLAVDPNLIQSPTSNEQSRSSNLDWTDQAPNLVLADDFLADGRIIESVRWWGADLTGLPPIDGWAIGFHEHLSPGGSAAGPLGLYFCLTADVVAVPQPTVTCDATNVAEYTVELADCCLIQTATDSRSGFTPANAVNFDSETCLRYDLSIHAVAGRQFAEGQVMTEPTFLGSTPGNNTHSMWPTDDGKFVVTGEERTGGGIHVHEITDNGGSLSFNEVDSLSLTGAFSVHNQIIIGNRLYCSWYERGFQAFDIDPVTGMLTQVAEFDTSTGGGGNWGVYPFLGDDLILLSDMSNGLRIYNMVTESVVGFWDGYIGSYCDIWAQGDYVYLPNWPLGDGNFPVIHVIDISNPASPTLVNSIVPGPPNQFTSPQDVKIDNGILYVSFEADGADGVGIYDVRNPPAATLLATVRLPGFSDTHNVYFHQGYLYLADSSTPRVGIVDLTQFDPDNPPPSPITEAAWILTGVGTSFVHDITAKDGRLYAAAWDSGLWVYDISGSVTECVGSPTGNSAPAEFWGWQSTASNVGAHAALQGGFSMGPGGVWSYGPWSPMTTACGSTNMAFELLSSQPEPVVECTCFADAECADAEFCTYDHCQDGTCANDPLIYGDVDHNTVVNIFDLFCILDGFAQDFSGCSFVDDDIEPCGGNTVINIFDLFAVLGAFEGEDPCCQ